MRPLLEHPCPKSNWKLVDNGRDRYTNALLRHLVQEDDNLMDDESKLLHASHIAFNALARLYFIMQEEVKPIHYIDDFFGKILKQQATIPEEEAVVSFKEG